MSLRSMSVKFGDLLLNLFQSILTDLNFRIKRFMRPKLSIVTKNLRTRLPKFTKGVRKQNMTKYKRRN